MKRIELSFGKADTRLAGNPYGRDVFSKQVKDVIDYSDVNTIVFPNSIDKIASSFVQGFFAEVIEKIGYARFTEVVKIEAKTDELVKQIFEDLLF